MYDQILNILTASWSRKTSTKWTEECPAKGQCGVTALVIQDVCGGDILKTKTGSSWHFYNRIDGEIYDFTSGQFSEPIVYQHIPSSRSEAFSDTNENQYGYLTRAFRKNMETEREKHL
ncbi:hypothetical protein QRX25_15620 [Bacillus sp. L381]|uniref:YunG family protein n=1 Tax=Bacillus TaxID=1386 RepID=UPI000826ECA6|nr:MULTISPECIES: hypothetical protein [Bacillus]AOC92333.1 uncharacterized protein BARD7_02893 [Bacillus amyloliquefaciens]MCR9039363.1 hypothetical protein [Bacillus velezensis]QBG57678.1 hypothetical protein D2M30_3378 [Bacillus amyloliquefaciens]QUN08901.1 hypothetical protein KEF49_15415 [Bacillus amyloliquefaciens]QYM81975.1 hypothetical protein KTJ85_15265 [Bacillus sp. 7D3]